VHLVLLRAARQELYNFNGLLVSDRASVIIARFREHAWVILRSDHNPNIPSGPEYDERQHSQIPEKITYEHSRIRFSTAISFTLSRFPMAMSK